MKTPRLGPRVRRLLQHDQPRRGDFRDLRGQLVDVRLQLVRRYNRVGEANGNGFVTPDEPTGEEKLLRPSEPDAHRPKSQRRWQSEFTGLRHPELDVVGAHDD